MVILKIIMFYLIFSTPVSFCVKYFGIMFSHYPLIPLFPQTTLIYSPENYVCIVATMASLKRHYHSFKHIFVSPSLIIRFYILYAARSCFPSIPLQIGALFFLSLSHRLLVQILYAHYINMCTYARLLIVLPLLMYALQIGRHITRFPIIEFCSNKYWMSRNGKD